MSILNHMKKIKLSSNMKTLFLTLVVGLLLGYLVTSSGYLPNLKNISVAKAKVAAEKYISSLPLDSYEITEFVSDGDVYRMELVINGYPYTSYMSKDGRFLFQGGIDLTQSTEEDTTADAQNQPATELPKTEKPVVELFVMSYCPYGTQMEKGILPVVNALKDKIDFTIKFVDYAMHGEKEVVENLTQYCIQKDMGKDVFDKYLSCFLDAGDSESCIASTGINKSALNSCTTQTDSEFKVMELYNDQSTWEGSYPPFNTSKEDNVKYSVAGSPTLIINGVEASTNRDPASLLATVCSAFDNKPEECGIVLDSASPTPGFGSETTTTTTGSAEAQCN